jgi:tRNA threonylcarbamoyladenosine biosynthesis protein TsaB
MVILTIRTDKPEAEIGLFDDETQLAYETWSAHRQLAETLHEKIKTLLEQQQKTWHDVQGLVCFKGPGSFTGLRIGLTVGNTLAYGLGIPIVSSENDDWIAVGVSRLLHGETEPLALPEYGSPVHITKPRA